VEAAGELADTQATLATADAICRKDFVLMGRRIRWPGQQLDWRWDPDSPHRWPASPSAEIDVRHCHGPRNPRRTWELNRHQFWLALGRARALSGDGLFAEEWAAQLAGWEQMNPPDTGVNWVSTLEMSLRLISWQLSAELMIDDPRIDAQTAVRWTARMVDQARRVWAELARPPADQGTLHRLTCASALAVVGMSLPGLAEAGDWRQAGLDELDRLAERSLAGGAAELARSPGGYRYAAQLLALVVARGRQSATEVPSAVVDALDRLADLLAWLTADDGTLPAYGDYDGSLGWWLSDRHRADGRGGLSTLAVLLQRADLKARAGRLDQEAAWLVGRQAITIWDALEDRPVDRGQRAFPAVGCYVRRGRDVDLLVRNPSQAHRPCGDNLSVSLRRDGRELITEAGPFGWSDPPTWQAYFRSAGSKNTLRIDGQTPRGQSRREAVGPQARTNFFAPDGPFLLDGEHAGFAERGAGHRRIVLELDERTWLVIDRLAGRQEHEIELRWQLDSRFEARTEADGVIAATAADAPGVALAAAGTGRLDWEVACGRQDPPAGWIRSPYGGAEPAPQAIYRVRSALPALMVTSISLDGEPARVERLAVRGRRFRCQLTRSRSMTVVAYEARRPSVARRDEDIPLGRVVPSDGQSRILTGRRV
jgi:hypothetical protein